MYESKIDLSQFEGHTKGPWKAAEYHQTGVAVISAAGDGVGLAYQRVAWVVEDRRPWPTCTPQQMANACLIAAAPLLLAEVEWLQAEVAAKNAELAALKAAAREYMALQFATADMGYRNRLAALCEVAP
jgi:hypothetical protein